MAGHSCGVGALKGVGRIRSRLLEAAIRVVRLYESWGKNDAAVAWKERLHMTDLPADIFAPP